MTSTPEDHEVLKPAVAALLALDSVVDMSRLPTIVGATLGRPLFDPADGEQVEVRLQLPGRPDVGATALDLAEWATAVDAVCDVHVRMRPLSMEATGTAVMGWVEFTLHGVIVGVWTIFPTGDDVGPAGDWTIGDLYALARVDGVEP